MSNRKPKVYLAGPIQHADDGGHGWRDRVISEYSDSFEWVNPLDEFDGGEDTATIIPEEVAEGYEADPNEEVITDRQVVETDKELVHDVDALLIGYHEKVSAWGTPFEQAEVWGSNAFGDVSPTKPVAVWHRHIPWDELSPWLRFHSTFYSREMESTVEYLKASVGAIPLCLNCRHESGANLEGIRFEYADETCENCGRNTSARRQSGEWW